VRDWLEPFAACGRAAALSNSRPFWHPDIVIFGTYQELVQSLSAWTEQQWDNVWRRTAEFRFDLENTMVYCTTKCDSSRWLLFACCLAWASKCFADQPVEYMLNTACGGP
jgi:hypothetical protein